MAAKRVKNHGNPGSLITEIKKFARTKRQKWWLVVNAKPIQTFFMETEKFKEEIKQAVSQNT